MSRNRSRWLAIAILSGMLLGCMSLGGSGGLPVDSPAPDFAVQRGGGTVQVSDLVGRVVVVNFWSST